MEIHPITVYLWLICAQKGDWQKANNQFRLAKELNVATFKP